MYKSNANTCCWNIIDTLIHSTFRICWQPWRRWDWQKNDVVGPIWGDHKSRGMNEWIESIPFLQMYIIWILFASFIARAACQACIVARSFFHKIIFMRALSLPITFLILPHHQSISWSTHCPPFFYFCKCVNLLEAREHWHINTYYLTVEIHDWHMISLMWRKGLQRNIGALKKPSSR